MKKSNVLFLVICFIICGYFVKNYILPKINHSTKNCSSSVNGMEQTDPTLINQIAECFIIDPPNILNVHSPFKPYPQKEGSSSCSRSRTTMNFFIAKRGNTKKIYLIY